MTTPIPPIPPVPSIPPLPHLPAPRIVPPRPLPPRRSDGERLVSFLLDHNPFYLFSAVSMLYGCYLLNSALDVRTDEIGKLIWLLVTTNLYEAALIVLGLFLFLRRGLRRDARMLFILQAFFLADATFLISEAASTREVGGTILSVILLLLALAKVYIIFRLLKLECSLRTLGTIALQLLALFSVPILLRHIADDGTLPARPFYGLWWITLLIPLAHDLLTRILPPTDEVRAAERAPELRVAYLIIPYISLLAHLGFLHWVFRADFVAADLTPILLGLAIALLRVKPTRFLPLAHLRVLQVVLPIVALLVSLDAADDIAFHLGRFASPITPLLLSLLATPLVVSYCLAIRTLPYVVATLVVLGTAFLFGPSLATIATVSRSISRFLTDLITALIPRTNTGWGVLAILTSFLFLAMGAIVSIFRTPPAAAQPAAPPPPPA